MNDNNRPVKTFGYLEKKGKLRMVSTWKKYWFVLEDRLLLYYRSKDEYDALSPFKGTINLGPPCTVKSYPSTVCAFQIHTRSNNITLRTENEVEQKRWMQAIMQALKQSPIHRPDSGNLTHFKRYSLENVFPSDEPPRNPHPEKAPKSNSQLRAELSERLRKLGAQSYGGSLGAISGDKDRAILRRTTSNDVDSKDDLYECIPGDDNHRSTFLVDNENYGMCVRNNQRDTVLVENDQYCTTGDLMMMAVLPKTEVIYDEPQIIPNSARGDNNNCEHQYESVDYLMAKSGDEDGKKEKKVKKSQSFIRSVFRRKEKKVKNPSPSGEDIYEELDGDKCHKLETSDEKTLQMLTEIQTILECKRPLVKKISTRPSVEGDLPTDPERLAPILPPKKHKINRNDPVITRSIDEILDDLDKEKASKTNKVKQLIEKFSESEDDEVVLRKHQRNPVKIQRHSEELYQLLDELTKVTSAPILTPGVTTSLVNPNLSEEEWLKLLPIKERRLSEPDYDIPRSHKSILEQLKKSDRDVGNTGFVTPPEEYRKREGDVGTLPKFLEDSLCISMTPDSLEVDASPKTITFQSHHYIEEPQLENDIIYALPKPYISTHIVNTCRNICGADSNEDQAIIYKNVRNHDEVFVDSLELCNESLTEF